MTARYWLVLAVGLTLLVIVGIWSGVPQALWSDVQFKIELQTRRCVPTSRQGSLVVYECADGGRVYEN